MVNRKIRQSPYYYMVNNNPCFVNKHNGGEVFFTDRVHKFGSGKSWADRWFYKQALNHHVMVLTLSLFLKYSQTSAPSLLLIPTTQAVHPCVCDSDIVGIF